MSLESAQAQAQVQYIPQERRDASRQSQQALIDPDPMPWDPLPNESARAYQAFVDYYKMGGGRSLSKLHKAYLDQSESLESGRHGGEFPTTSYGSLADWSRRHKWQARVNQWQAHDARQQSEIWNRRQTDLRDQDFSEGERLRGLAWEILEDMPRFVRRSERVIPGEFKTIIGQDGKEYQVTIRPERVIVTLELNAKTALQAVRLAREMQHESIGDMGPDTKEVRLVGADGGAIQFQAVPDTRMLELHDKIDQMIERGDAATVIEGEVEHGG